MPPRYNTGYGRSSSMYRYDEPSISQYESFFNPIPLEFVQQQFDRRQGAYDQGYAMAIEAKDQFGGAKVGAPDIAYKNQLVNKYVDDIDKTVQDQFGGDYGKAAKAIARTVTEVRGNDFWQKAQMMDQLREEERKLTAQYGPDALVFNSIQNKSVYDSATGKTIDPGQMKYDVVRRGDWGKTIDEIFSKVKPSTNLWGLSQDDFGYLRSGKTTEISADGIAKLAKDKNIQNAILSAHPEMSRAFNELPQERAKWFGDNYNDLGKAVESMILGRTSTMPYKQQDDSYIQNWQAKAAAENTGNKTTGGAFGPERGTAGYNTGYGTTRKGLRETKNFIFGQNGTLKSGDTEGFGVLTPTEMAIAKAHPATGNGKMTERYFEELDKAKDQITKERESNPLYQARKTQFNQVKSIVKDIRSKNSDLVKGKSDWDVYNDYLNDTENRYKVSMDLSLPVIKPDIKKTIGESIASNINGTEFFLTDGSKVTKDWNEKNGIGKQTGLTYAGFQEMLRKGDLALAYNKTRGSMYVEIPVIKGDIKLSSDGTINWDQTKTEGKKTVYFSPDRELSGVAKLIPYLDQLIKDSKASQNIPEGLTDLFGTIKYDKSRLDSSKDVNDQEVFLMKDSEGNDEWYSLDEIRNHMAKYVNSYLSTYYNVKQ